MRMGKQKEKQKSIPQKQYEMLRSIYDEVEQELYCLKKQEEILIKLIQREEKKINQNYTTSISFPQQPYQIKKQYNLRRKNSSTNVVGEGNEEKQKIQLKSHIPLSHNDQIDITQSYLYTGKGYQQVSRKNHRKEDIFKMDQQLYQQEDEDYDKES